MTTKHYPNDPLLVTPDELHARLGDPVLALIDTRPAEAFCAGHIPGAAHTYLALRLLGYPRVRAYLGSWREWGNRLDLPIEHPTKL
jgi:3-mercaptopyruvate sulfurtransferase SseA